MLRTASGEELCVLPNHLNNGRVSSPSAMLVKSSSTSSPVEKESNIQTPSKLQDKQQLLQSYESEEYSSRRHELASEGNVDVMGMQSSSSNDTNVIENSTLDQTFKQTDPVKQMANSEDLKKSSPDPEYEYIQAKECDLSSEMAELVDAKGTKERHDSLTGEGYVDVSSFQKPHRSMYEAKETGIESPSESSKKRSSSLTSQGYVDVRVLQGGTSNPLKTVAAQHGAEEDGKRTMERSDSMNSQGYVDVMSLGIGKSQQSSGREAKRKAKRETSSKSPSANKNERVKEDIKARSNSVTSKGYVTVDSLDVRGSHSKRDHPYLEVIRNSSVAASDEDEDAIYDEPSPVPDRMFTPDSFSEEVLLELHYQDIYSLATDGIPISSIQGGGNKVPSVTTSPSSVSYPRKKAHSVNFGLSGSKAVAECSNTKHTLLKVRTATSVALTENTIYDEPTFKSKELSNVTAHDDGYANSTSLNIKRFSEQIQSESKSNPEYTDVEVKKQGRSSSLTSQGYVDVQLEASLLNNDDEEYCYISPQFR